MIMKFYYANQTERWLTEDEQTRFHLDYDPQPTKELALAELRRFLCGRLREQMKWFESWISTLERVPPA
jgi:hypothetical protein